MINVKKVAPNIVIDMRYATTDNFTGKKLYDSDACFLIEPAANRLARVQKKLEKRGLGLKIWDCYRPVSVQQKLWDTVPDSRYVANPKTGSRHNRGASVDLTLVDSEGQELPMPTGFDSFEKKAHRDYKNLPKKILKNRKILEDAMESEGFMGLPTEWWHFDDPEWSHYEIRNDPVGSSSLTKDVLPKDALVPLAGKTKQVILILSEGWNSNVGKMALYERHQGKWVLDRDPIAISLGKKGMAWGQGVNAPRPGDPIKKEGDLRAPAGAFEIGPAFGTAPSKPTSARWPYRRMTDDHICVDDPKSSRYNRIIEQSEKPRDWRSAEDMIRKDGLYEWGLVINQNFPSVLKGRGSCIFFHIWRKPKSPTEGCSAMEKEDLLYLLSWLEPEKNPLLIQLPKKSYLTLKKPWNLP